MSQTAFRANIIKDQFTKIMSGLKEFDHPGKEVSYILNRLWPELEAAIEEEWQEYS